MCRKRFDDDLGADDIAEEPPGNDVGDGKGICGLTFHEFLPKKAVVLSDLFRIKPFMGLGQRMWHFSRHYRRRAA